MVAQAADFDPKALDDPKRFVPVTGCEVFDEHDEPGPDGKVDRFDKARLEKIAEKCNHLYSLGQPCPITIGHTLDNAKSEEDQPEQVGYARRFTVKKSEKHGRHILYADFLIEAQKFDKAAEYKRVSVERWSDGQIDPIALLRKTPARPVAQWIYGKGLQTLGQVYGEPDDVGAVFCYAKHGGREVVRYSMESQVLYPNGVRRYEFPKDDEPKDEPKEKPDDKPEEEPTGKGDDAPGGDAPVPGTGDDAPGGDAPAGDPTAPLGADDGDKGGGLDNLHGQLAMKYGDHLLQTHPAFKQMGEEYAKQCAAAPAAAVGGTNAMMPSAEPARNAKKPASVADKVLADDKPKVVTPDARYEKRLAAIEEREKKANQRYARSEADKLLTQLDREGYLLGTTEDRTELRDEFADLIVREESGEAKEGAVKSRYAKVKRTHQCDPAGGPGIIPVDSDPDVTTGKPSRNAKSKQDMEDNEAAIQYCREHPEMWNFGERAIPEALKKVREAKKGGKS